MQRFNQFKLKKLILLFVVEVIILLYYAFPVYYDALHIQAQLQQQQSPSIIGIKITSPSTGQQVPVGELTISGISTDNATTDCTVYADWNNTKPFQNATATGPGGVNDYSTWNFTYAQNYHLITNGTNELTAKLSCINNPMNVTKWNSVNVIGVADAEGAREEQQNSRGGGTSSLPPVVIDKEEEDNNNNYNNNNTAATTTTTTPLPSPCCPSNGYIANAGPDQTALEGTIITLNGSGNNNNNKSSSNIGNTAAANYLWRQMDGHAIILNGNNTAHPTFVAPNYPNDTKYTFALEVYDNQVVNNNNNNNQTGSAIDTVDIIVKDANMEAKSPGSLQEEQNNDGNISSSSASIPTPFPPPLSPSNQEQEEEDKDVAEEEPEPQSTTSLTEDDKIEDTAEEENIVKQEKKVEEVQEEEKVQEQLQQMLEKTGKIDDEEVQQKVEKVKENILDEIKNALK
jgi:hypothetical protein